MNKKAGLVLATGVVAVALATPALLDMLLLDQTEFEFETSLTAEPAPANQELNGIQPGIGINADRNLQLGTLFVGASVTKQLNISTGSTTSLRISSSGNISRVLEYENQRTVKPPVATAEIEAKPREPGYYAGTVKVTAQTPGSELGERWLELR
jgi:hypothetical protein